MRSLFALFVVSAMSLCVPARVNAQSRHVSGTVYYADTGQGRTTFLWTCRPPRA